MEKDEDPDLNLRSLAEDSPTAAEDNEMSHF